MGAMRRATISISSELEEALETYMKQQDAPPSLTTLMQAALREYLAHRGLAPAPSPLKITPARKGSGRSDVSLHHDHYFADGK
jgi:hypothetical protein